MESGTESAGPEDLHALIASNTQGRNAERRGQRTPGLRRQTLTTASGTQETSCEGKKGWGSPRGQRLCGYTLADAMHARRTGQVDDAA